MLSVSDKYDSVNERTQEISELMKLHIQGVWQNAHEFIRRLVHIWSLCKLNEHYYPQNNCKLSATSAVCIHEPDNTYLAATLSNKKHAQKYDTDLWQ